MLALTNKSLGPAADRHQTARPVPESRICAFVTLFTATFYAPPLCMVNVEFPFTSEPSPGPFLIPFPPELMLLHPSNSHNCPTSLSPLLSPSPRCSGSKQEPKQLMMLFLLSTETAITLRLHPRAYSAKPAWPHLMTIHYLLTHKAFQPCSSSLCPTS